ncbi:hypothetical protein F2Q70_00044558 [Brassica cretica]|uniref:Uncharacterized protein n=1 Tax=Brassica cretica TaxID=69181 RepID=A0A8S9KKH5_BRACR|nr:hypothetical protein F2Q70_00044558 [Brassica cretica]
MLNFRFSRSLPGMDGSGGVVCPAPAPVLHLSFDGRPALTPETTPSSSVMLSNQQQTNSKWRDLVTN